MENNQHPPPCYIYDLSTGKWCSFKTLIIQLDNTPTELFHYTNESSTSDILIRKSVSYDYIAYYMKAIPSNLKRKHSFHNPISTYSEQLSEFSENKTTSNKSVDIKSILVLEDLPLRYGSLQEDQYILLGFEIESYKYDEGNFQLKYIRDLISDLHMKLKYSEEGLVYQVSKRMQMILYKTLKYALVYMSGMFNISPDISVERKLQEIHKISFDPTLQDYIQAILEDKKFYNEVLNLAYKAIMVVGLFPSYVELNTMNEKSLWLKVKNIMTNSTNAPYGASHHASFSLGNFRYSFIFDFFAKEKQKVNITEELKRGFSLKNQAFEYFRVKFFDFFPMDSWVSDIANRAITILHIYFLRILDLVPEEHDGKNSLKMLLKRIVETNEDQAGKKAVTVRIAREFYNRYGDQLDHSKNGKIFKKITKVLSDAELRGYKNLMNNCQTVVSEIIALLSQYLKKLAEPVIDLSKIPDVKGVSQHDIQEFLKFGSQFNRSFASIGPFPLTHRLSYFDTFADKDTCEMLYPKNFENIKKIRKEYICRENVREFLAKLKEELGMASKIHIRTSVTDLDQEEEALPNIDWVGGEKYSVVSCLVHLIYNELFDIRREIKIARQCEEDLMEIDDDESVKDERKVNKKEIKEWKAMVEKLPGLYKEKYEMLELYQELCYYYYNTVRLGTKIKVTDSISCLGFLLVRKPDYVEPERSGLEGGGRQNRLS